MSAGEAAIIGGEGRQAVVREGGDIAGAVALEPLRRARVLRGAREQDIEAVVGQQDLLVGPRAVDQLRRPDAFLPDAPLGQVLRRGAGLEPAAPQPLRGLRQG